MDRPIAAALCALALAFGCGSRTAEPDRPVEQPIDAGPPPIDAPPPDRVAGAVAELDRKIATIRARLANHPPDIADLEWVKKKLATMVAVDQLVRSAAPPGDYSVGETFQYNQALMSRAREIDRRNTRSLAVLIRRHGWITIGKFGRVASQNAWLLAQHADHDVAFQKKVLAMLEPLVKKKQVRPSDYAYLYDRVATAEGRAQRYGTQGKCVGPGRWQPNPIEDAVNVDQRRAEVGLPTLAEYKRAFKDICR